MNESFNLYKKTLVYKQLDRETEKQLLTNYKVYGCIHSREKLINHNLRFVVFVAKRYRNMNIDFMDIVSVGNMGVIKAVDKYDITMVNDVSLATYAERWIRYEILRLFDKTTLLKIPSTKNVLQLVTKLRKSNVVDYSTGKIDSKLLKEFAQSANISYSDAESLSNAIRPTTDLYSEQIQSISVEPDYDEPNTAEKLETLYTYMDNNLPERWVDIIKSKHLQGKTLKELGEKYGCSGSRIDQIEKKALRKIKNELTSVIGVL